MAELSVIPGSGALLPKPASRQEVLATQRGRLMDAIASVVAEKGYGEVTVGDVVKRAATSRRTFYEHFEDKEQCFLATYRVGAELILGDVMTAAAANWTDWRSACRAGMGAYFGLLSEEPAFARACLVEVRAAGAAAALERERVHDRFAQELIRIHDFARASEPQLERPPIDALILTVAGIEELAVRRIRAGRTKRLRELVDVVMPFLETMFFAYASPAGAGPTAADGRQL